MPELQTIPARHGVATFVPAGQTIKIINSSGTQVVDVWAFALPAPEPKNNNNNNNKSAEEGSEKKAPSKQQSTPSKAKAKNGKTANEDFPSQEDAEKATQQAIKQGDEEQAQQQKSSWSSYVPSLGWSSGDKDKNEAKDGKETGETEQQKNSKTWSTYFPSGQGFSSYIPQSASDTVSAFTASVSKPFDCVGFADGKADQVGTSFFEASPRSEQDICAAAAGLLQNSSGRSRLER